MLLLILASTKTRNGVTAFNTCKTILQRQNFRKRNWSTVEQLQAVMEGMDDSIYSNIGSQYQYQNLNNLHQFDKGNNGVTSDSTINNSQQQQQRNNENSNQPLIRLPQINPSKQYIMHVEGKTAIDVPGAGVGIFLYDSSFIPIWAGRVYLPGDRNLFEADYTSLYIALQYASQVFGIKILQLSHGNEAMVNQLNGNFDVSKSSLVTILQQTQDYMQQNFESVRTVHREKPPQQLSIGDRPQLAKTALATRKTLPLLFPDSNNDGHPTLNLASLVDPMEFVEHKTPYLRQSQQHQNQNAKSNDNIQPTTTEPETETTTTTPATITEAVGYPAISTPIDPNKVYRLQFDGGSRKQAQIAGAGMVIFDDELEHEVWCGWRYHDQESTNNVAEYVSLLTGLKCAYSLGIRKLIAEGDSELVVKQVNGKYKCHNVALRVMLDAAQDMVKKFDSLTLRHIPRQENSRADWLANQAMNEKQSYGYIINEQISATTEQNENNSSVNFSSNMSSMFKSSDKDNDISNNDNDDSQNINIQPDTKFSPNHTYQLQFDGRYKKTTTIIGAGVVLLDQDNNKIWSGWKFGVKPSTNNEAVYFSLQSGLEHALKLDVRRIHAFGDYQLIVQQVKGEIKCTSPVLIDCLDKVQSLIQQFDSFEISLIDRKDNKFADSLAGQAVETQTSFGFDMEPTLSSTKNNNYDNDENGTATKYLDTISPLNNNKPPETLLQQDTTINHQDSSMVNLANNPSSQSNSIPRPHNSIMIDPTKTYILQFDGGSRGNPGISGCGFVIWEQTNNDNKNHQSDKEVCHGYNYIPNATNNEAEYQGLLEGLKCASELGIQKLFVQGDSQLVVRQVRGEYKCRKPHLQIYLNQIKNLIMNKDKNFDVFDIDSIPRAENSRADELANIAMDTRQSYRKKYS